MEDLDCGNLVLTRKEGESICIGDNIMLTIQQIEMQKGGRVFVSVRAPKSVKVHRNEVYERIKNEANGNKY